MDGATAAPSPPSPPSSPSPGHITLIGTGHVYDQDDVITGAIHAVAPAMVGVELDPGRLRALLAKAEGRELPRRKNAPLLHRWLESYQARIADSHGTMAGQEMLAAARAGQNIGARVALLDRPAEETLQRVIKEVSWRERARVVALLAAMPFKTVVARLRGRSDHDTVEDEMARYQDDPLAVLEELRATFPTVHRVVIAERDALMAERVRRAADQGHDIVAVVGDGHIAGMLAHLDGHDTTAYRLGDVRAGRLPKPTQQRPTATPTPGPDGATSSSSVSWGVDVDVT